MLLAVMVFDLRITSANALGIAVTLAGGAWYTVVELHEKERAKLRCASVAFTTPDAIRVEPSKEPESSPL